MKIKKVLWTFLPLLASLREEAGNSPEWKPTSSGLPA